MVAPGIDLGNFGNLGNEADPGAGTCPGSRLLAQVGPGSWGGCMGHGVAVGGGGSCSGEDEAYQRTGVVGSQDR